MILSRALSLSLSLSTSLGLLLAAGCMDPEPPTPPTRLELKTYEVDPGIAQEAVSLLNSVIPGEHGGRARLGPDGRVVVVADASMMAGVDQMLGQLAAGSVAPSPRVRMEYWLVMGQPADDVALDPSVEHLRPVLDEVAAAQAPMHFSLVEAVSVRAESGEAVEATGLRVELFQRASVRGDSVVADLNIQPAGGTKVQTRVSLSPGQTLVLGETGYDATPWNGPSDTDPARPAMLYYVVRPTVEGARGGQ